MANKPQASKYFRASQRRRMRNKPIRTRMRTTVRDAVGAIAGGDLNDAQAAVDTALVALDRAALRGVIHANNAARRKSRLLRHLSAVRDTSVQRRPRVRPPAPVQVP